MGYVLGFIVTLGVLAAIIWFTWGFWLGFAVLTFVYLVIAGGIIYALESYYDREHGEYFRDNNTWFFVGVGAFAVTFVIACFNFGPALLLPENLPTKEQRGFLDNVFNHLLYGKFAPAKTIPTDPLPWTTGTWFWWKAFGIYFFFTFFYAWYAFSDEIAGAFRAVVNRRRSETRRRHTGPATGHTEEDTDPSHFWKPDFWDIVSIFEMLTRLLSTRRRNGN